MPKSISSWIPSYLKFDADHVPVEIKRLDLDTYEAYFLEYLKFTGRDVRGQAVPEEDIPNDERIKRIQANHVWIKASLADYVRFPAGALDIDGEPILTGAQFIHHCGGRSDLISDLITDIWLQNNLPEAVAKNLRSPLGSPRGSANEPATAVNGNKPGPTAEPAVDASIAATAGVTAPPSDGSFGTTDPSPSSPVPSSV